MEKIYMEDDNSQRQKRSVWNFSVVLSFVVAIFALFSLATFGVVTNQGTGVSYAAPITVTESEFHFYQGANNQSISATVGGTKFSVPMYYSDSSYTKPIFCVEHNTNVDGSGSSLYSKSGEIDDAGLLYILNNSFMNENKITDGGNRYVETWATQIAIWLYLSETHADKADAAKHTLTASELNVIQNATTLEVTGQDDVSASGVYAKIRTLVDTAKQYKNTGALDVTKASGEISKTDDEKYYQSTLITVTGNPSSSFNSYDISLSGIDGAFAVDEDGNPLTLTNVAAGKKFYVRIPVENVNETVQTLQINILGHFDTLAGSYFVTTKLDENGDTLQKVVSVTGTTTNVSKGLEIEFVGAPDTGMNTAQTIYFIGLIVLLCGVGIVYANAKPVESKQQ